MDRRRPPQRTASFPTAPGFRPWLLVLLLSVFLLLFLPSFLSKGIRPAAAGLIKNGWDALNFLLVLFAILCGLLSRNSTPDDSPRHPLNYQKSEPAPATPSFNDGLTYHYQPSPFNRHRRSSSYPDLRQEALPAEQWRFSDDIQLSRSSAREAMPQAIPAEQWRFSDDIQLNRSSAREAMPQNWKLDDIQFPQPDNDSSPELDPKIDTTVLNKNQTTEKVRQDCEAEAVVAGIGDTLPDRTPLSGRRMRSSSSYPDLRQEWIPAEDWRFFDDIDLHRRQPEQSEVRTIPVDTVKLRSSTPPSPPPPPPRRRRTARKVPKPDPEPEVAPAPPPLRAPPPPPPLPPPTPPRQHQRKKSGGGPKDLASALAHYYQKKRKKSVSRSKTAYDSGVGGGGGGGGAAPPPPPPMPPPPSSVFNKLFNHKKSGGKSKKVHTTPPPPPPPPPQISRLSSPLPPTSPHSVRRRRERSGSNSNLRTPPTPPPPQAAAAESPATSCPPSPDVNNKADMFIARFRAGLQLEKQNSMKARTPAAAAPVAEEEEIMVIGTLFD